MLRRPIPDFIVDAAAKAAQSGVLEHDELLVKRRQRDQQARSITAQMRRQYQRSTLLPATVNGSDSHADTEMHAAASTNTSASSSSSSSDRPEPASRQSEGEVKQEEPPAPSAKPAPSALSSSSSTLPSTFLEWRAKRAATSAAAATANTATAAATTAVTPTIKRPPPTTTISIPTPPAQPTTRPAAAPATTKQPARTVPSSRPTTTHPTAAHHTAASASQPLPLPPASALPPCPQGLACTRQNATHRSNFSHSPTAAHTPTTTISATKLSHIERAKQDAMHEEQEGEVGEEDDGWQTGRAISTAGQHVASKKRLRRLNEDDGDERMEDERSAAGSSEERAMPRPVCPYGAQCYRVNPVHLRQFQHPLQTVGTMKAGRAR